MESPVELSQLPTEIQRKILSYLPTRDLVAVECVSRSFQQLVADLLEAVRVVQFKTDSGRFHGRYVNVSHCSHLQDAYFDHRTVFIKEASTPKRDPNEKPFIQVIVVTDENRDQLQLEASQNKTLALTQPTVDTVIKLAKRCPNIECLDLYAVRLADVDLLLQLVEAFPKFNCLCLDEVELSHEDWQRLSGVIVDRLVHLHFDRIIDGPISQLIAGSQLERLFFPESRKRLNDQTATALSELNERVELILNISYIDSDVSPAIAAAVSRANHLKTMFVSLHKLHRNNYKTINCTESIDIDDRHETGYELQNRPVQVSFPFVNSFKVVCLCIKKITELRFGDNLKRLEIYPVRCFRRNINELVPFFGRLNHLEELVIKIIKEPVAQLILALIERQQVDGFLPRLNRFGFVFKLEFLNKDPDLIRSFASVRRFPALRRTDIQIQDFSGLSSEEPVRESEIVAAVAAVGLEMPDFGFILETRSPIDGWVEALKRHRMADRMTVMSVRNDSEKRVWTTFDQRTNNEPANN